MLTVMLEEKQSNSPLTTRQEQALFSAVVTSRALFEAAVLAAVEVALALADQTDRSEVTTGSDA